MEKLKINTETLINAYKDGQSLNSIARAFGTYPTTVKRILEKNRVELRHDATKKGNLIVKDGERLIEWAKAQGRLVTKTELAEVIGRKKLSPSYFIKYPELGQYIEPRDQKETLYYSRTLYAWLKANGIPFKPNDRKALNVSVTALLLGEYSNIVLQIAIKPKCVSMKKYSENMIEKKNRAHEQGMTILFIHENDFENLDELKERL